MLDTIVVITLTILGISFLFLLIFLIPVLLGLRRIFALLELLLSDVHREIIPQIKSASNFIGGISDSAQRGGQYLQGVFSIFSKFTNLNKKIGNK